MNQPAEYSQANRNEYCAQPSHKKINRLMASSEAPEVNLLSLNRDTHN
jgi:hypothetical protein